VNNPTERCPDCCPDCCQIWTGATSRKDDEIHICENCGEEWVNVEFQDETEEEKTP